MSKGFDNITLSKKFGGNHKKNLWALAYITHYIINIYKPIKSVFPCVVLGFCVVVQPSTVWGLVACLCAVCRPCRCGGRPSVRLAVVVAVVGLFGVVCCRCLLFRCGFGLPLSFWGVLWGFLAVFGGGVVCLLVRCFSWLVVAFIGFWLVSAVLSVVVGQGYPLPILRSFANGRLPPRDTEIFF